MKTSRRTFIRTGAMAVAGAVIMREQLMAEPGEKKKKKKGMVALQLYSIREEMGKDALGSLKQVAAMGYKYVEHANYVQGKFYKYDPKEFRKILDDLDLKMVSGHTGFGPRHWDETKNDFTDLWKKLVDDAAILGQLYVVSPSMEQSQYKTRDNLMKTIERFNKCGDLCHSKGMKFGYHNHDFEFTTEFEGKKMFDIIMDTIDRNKVVIQLDTGNLYNGGAIALDVMNKYKGRFENLHVKDEIKSSGGNEKYESCILGEGIVNIKNLLELATKTGGTELYVIEQESYQGKMPMECVRRDLEIMKSWGY
jgi:sugar phosphate isomerase/epimerase